MAGLPKMELTGILTSEFQLVIDKLNTRGLRQVLAKYRDIPLVITLAKLTKTRSDRQNRYYWGVVVPTIRAFFKETEGEIHTPEEVHTFVTTSVLGYRLELKVVGGIQIMVLQAKRTSEMTTAEFEEAMTKIRDHFAALDCLIPEPNQQNFLHDFLED